MPPAVDIFTKYNYVGTLFDNKHIWDDNTGIIVKKYQQRLNILCLLLRAFFVFNFFCWYFNMSVNNQNILLKTVCVSSKIIGDNQRDITISSGKSNCLGRFGLF